MAGSAGVAGSAAVVVSVVVSADSAGSLDLIEELRHAVARAGRCAAPAKKSGVARLAATFCPTRTLRLRSRVAFSAAGCAPVALRRSEATAQP